MSSIYHGQLTVTIFGQSHAPGIGVTVDGIPAGERVDLEELQAFLARRAPGGNAWSTTRKEGDVPEFLSGLADGMTCGAPLAAFIRIYAPAYFDRVGLRYLNFISRRDLGLEGVPFSQLIAPCYLGPLAEEDVAESAATRCTVNAEIVLRGGCRVKIHAGPGLVRRGTSTDREVKFIFDQDLFMPGQVPAKLVAGALQTLHSQAGPIFRGAITEKLHEAMEPEMI